MTHPGYNDAALPDLDGYTWQREKELRVLCSKELRDLLLLHEIELTSFADRVPRTSGASKLTKHH